MLKAYVLLQSLVKGAHLASRNLVILGCIIFILSLCKFHACSFIDSWGSQYFNAPFWENLLVQINLASEYIHEAGRCFVQIAEHFLFNCFRPVLYWFSKVQQAEATYIHPNWRGKYLYKDDAALLRLSVRVPIPTPVLADTKFFLHSNLRFHSFTLLAGLQIVEMDVNGDSIFRRKRCVYKSTGILTDILICMSLLLPI